MTLTAPRSTVAYFSMEICLEQAIPTYSGGLGVLAGDTLRSAADLGVPLVAVTLLHRKGYFEQHLDASGQQTEQPVHWSPEKVLEPVDARSTVTIEGREVHVARLEVHREGRPRARGAGVPARHECCPRTRSGTARSPTRSTAATSTIGSARRSCSGWGAALLLSMGIDGDTIVLGMGGAALLQALGYRRRTSIYHLNEGHSALLTLQLLERQLDGRQHFELDDADLEAVRQRCIFTTHTPVPAGHDKFPLDMVRHVLGDERVALLEGCGGVHEGMLNMTHLALHLTRFVNGVAMRHRDVSRGMFPELSDRLDHERRARRDVDAARRSRRCSTGASPSGGATTCICATRSASRSQEIRDAHAASKAMLLDEVAAAHRAAARSRR